MRRSPGSASITSQRRLVLLVIGIAPDVAEQEYLLSDETGAGSIRRAIAGLMAHDDWRPQRLGGPLVTSASAGRER